MTDMTTPAASKELPADVPPDPGVGRDVEEVDKERAKRHQSLDYWDIVFSQIKRRPSILISFGCLVFLYAVAIYAPFIANDRPFYFHGTDKISFRKAQREIFITAQSLVRDLESRLPEALDAPHGNPALTADERLDEEEEALSKRLRDLSSQLADEDDQIIEVARDQLDATMEAARAGDESALALAADLLESSRRIRELTPLHPNETANASQANVVHLSSQRSFPIVQDLSKGEVFFMVLWAMVILFPVWNTLVNRRLLGNNRMRMRRARRRKGLAMVLIPALAALLWPGEPAAFLVSTYKDGLTTGETWAERVVFPIIPYGIAETSDQETFRPPTWHLESEIDEAGYYKFGGRSGRFDRATGIPKVAQPVEPKFGELDRNAALRHPLGTDSLGRDMAARIIWGARVSLAVGLLATALLVFIGIIVGSIAGFYGGAADIVISRIIEIVQTFPVFFLILIVVAFIGPSIINIMLAIGLVNWTGVARLVRGEFLRLRSQDFVVASRALGVSSGRTIFRHVLPNAMGPVLVSATFSVAAGILIESSLSFLGFGIQLPIPSWGSLLIESRSAEHWWIQIYPGLLIFITVFLYNICGDGVRDALDPRLKAAR